MSELPSAHGIRERLLVELASLRERYAAAHASGGLLAWSGGEFWIDRVRLLVLASSTAKELGLLGLDTAPAEMEEDELEYHGCRKALTSTGELIEVLAAHVTGRTPYAPHAADLLNFAVAQPRVNPGFESLLWLGLAHQLRPNVNAANLGEAIGALAIDLARYPASHAEAPAVREAQVELVRKVVEPELDRDAWLRASERDWAQQCSELLHRHRALADNVFFQVHHTATRLR